MLIIGTITSCIITGSPELDQFDLLLPIFSPNLCARDYSKYIKYIENRISDIAGDVTDIQQMVAVIIYLGLETVFST
jgi:hypothetical protein